MISSTVICKPNNGGEPTIISCMSDFYMQGDLPVWYMIAMRMLLAALAISFCVADYKLVDREDFPAASECVWNAEATEVNT